MLASLPGDVNLLRDNQTPSHHTTELLQLAAIQTLGADLLNAVYFVVRFLHEPLAR